MLHNKLNTLCFVQIEVNDQEEGEVLMDNAKTVAFVQLSQNFSIGLQQKVLGSLTGDDNDNSIYSIAYANIDAGSEYVMIIFIVDPLQI